MGFFLLTIIVSDLIAEVGRFSWVVVYFMDIISSRELLYLQI